MSAPVQRWMEWRSIAAALELAPGVTLPHTTVCPFCQREQMVVYQDNIHGGQWHACTSCQTAGPVAELAARVWQCSWEDSVHRLVYTGKIAAEAAQEEGLAHYRRTVIARRDAIAKFWQEASTGPTQRAGCCYGLQGLLQQAGPDHARWQERVAPHIAAVPLATLSELIGRPLQAGRARRARKVREVGLAMPVYDLPGRISSLVLFTGDDDVCYQPLYGKKLLPGVVYPQAASLRHPELQGRLVVALDPAVAIRLQMRHLAACGELLPLVGVWGTSPPGDYLQRLATDRAMVWSLQPDKYAVAHAKALKAPLWGQGSVETPEDYLRRRTAIEFLLKIQERVEPWETVVARQLEKQTAHDATELVRSLELSPLEIQAVQDRCGKLAAANLSHALASKAELKRAVVNGRTVKETGQGWVVEKTGEVITNAVVRLEQLVCDPDGSNPYYRGQVLYKEQQIPFAVSQKELARAPIDWLQRLVREQRLGEPICNRRWASQLINLAQQFHQPVVLHETTRCGWDTENQAFVFPRFTIQRGGLVLPHPVPSRASLPCKAIMAPTGRLSEEEVQRLNGSLDPVGAVPAAWAALIHVTYNLTAAPCNRRRYGLFVNGPGSAVIRDLFTTIGCLSYDASKAVTAEKLCRASMPLLVRGSAKLFRQDLLFTASPNCVAFQVPEPFTLLWRINRRWGSLAAAAWPRCSEATLAAVAKVLPAYCQYLLARPDRAKPGSWLVGNDLAEWFTAQGGSADIVRQGNALLRPPGCRPAMGELLHWLANQQLLGNEPAEFRGNGKQLCLLTYPKQGLVWLPIDKLNELLVSRGWPAIQWDVVEKRARKSRDSDWKLGEKYVAGRGWLVPEIWWVRATSRARAASARLYAQ